MTERTPVGPVLVSPDSPQVRVARPDRIAQSAAVIAARLDGAAWAIACRSGTRPNRPRQDGCPGIGGRRFPAMTIGAWLISACGYKALSGENCLKDRQLRLSSGVPANSTRTFSQHHRHTRPPSSFVPAGVVKGALFAERKGTLLASRKSQRSLPRCFKTSREIIRLVRLCLQLAKERLLAIDAFASSSPKFGSNGTQKGVGGKSFPFHRALVHRGDRRAGRLSTLLPVGLNT